MTSDPIGLNGGLNTYGYALGNPTKFIDLMGLDVWGSNGIATSPGINTIGNGNWWSGYTPQDWRCTSPASGFNENECTKQCCIKHDACYEKHGCNVSSWIGNASGANGACQVCNAEVTRCIIENIGNNHCDDKVCI